MNLDDKWKRVVISKVANGYTVCPSAIGWNDVSTYAEQSGIAALLRAAEKLGLRVKISPLEEEGL